MAKALMITVTETYSLDAKKEKDESNILGDNE